MGHTTDRYAVVSADCHGGASVLGYKPFLASNLHDDFDRWAAGFENPYADNMGDDADRNWSSERRLAEMEADGVLAEVLFPNTVPPFFPKGSLVEQPPGASDGDLAKRWAGLQAHNRWLADFCSQAPGRRAGLAEIMLHDVDASVREIEWAKANGLTGGVLLPGAPPGSGVPPLYAPDYEPIWSVCEDLGMPVNHHSGSAVPDMGPYPAAQMMFLLEVVWWAHRALWHLIYSGVMERHPTLQFVFTEQGTAWLPDELTRLDYYRGRFSGTGGADGSQEAKFGAGAVEQLSLSPSEYWRRQCHVGASFIRRHEVAMRDQVGVERIMWGSDYPHLEGCWPFSKTHLRMSFAGVAEDDVRAMVGRNAAELYGLDWELLERLADEHGPTPAEVAVPLDDEDIPDEALRCPAFAAREVRPVTVEFNPLEEGFIDWPYDQYRRLRAEAPVHRSELLHGWVVTRYDDVNTLLRDPAISVEIEKAHATPLTTSEIERRDTSFGSGRTLVLLDDPDHARLRKLVAKPFRSSKIDELQQLIHERIDARVDALVAEHGVGEPAELDLIADFAYPLPVEIFCELLGIPEEDHPIFRYWVNSIARSLDPVMEPEERDQLLQDLIDMYAFLEELVAAKRGRDDDDVLADLIRAEEDGETLTHEELIAQVITLYVAGHEPTAGLVGNGLRALLDFPDQWKLLKDDRSLLRNAVTELLRYDGPNQFVRRVTLRDIDFDTPTGSVTVPTGSVVYASPGSANRDEAQWGPTVDQVDITRADAGSHLQFGAGIHSCVGSHLARVQAEAMFAAILDRFDDIEIAGDPVWSTRMVIRGLSSLPIRARLC